MRFVDITEKNAFSEEKIKKAEDICLQKILDRFNKEPSDLMMQKIFKTALRIEATEYLRCQKH